LGNRGWFGGDRFCLREFYEQLLNLALFVRLGQAGLRHISIFAQRWAGGEAPFGETSPLLICTLTCAVAFHEKAGRSREFWHLFVGLPASPNFLGLKGARKDRADNPAASTASKTTTPFPDAFTAALSIDAPLEADDASFC